MATRDDDEAPPKCNIQNESETTMTTHKASREGDAMADKALANALAALQAQVRSHKLMADALGFDHQAHLDGTAQARNAIAELEAIIREHMPAIREKLAQVGATLKEIARQSQITTDGWDAVAKADYWREFSEEQRKLAQRALDALGGVA